MLACSRACACFLSLFCRGLKQALLLCRRTGRLDRLTRCLACSAPAAHTYHAPLFTALKLDYDDEDLLACIEPAEVQPEWLQVQPPERCLVRNACCCLLPDWLPGAQLSDSSPCPACRQ